VPQSWPTIDRIQCCSADARYKIIVRARNGAGRRRKLTIPGATFHANRVVGSCRSIKKGAVAMQGIGPWTVGTSLQELLFFLPRRMGEPCCPLSWRLQRRSCADRPRRSAVSARYAIPSSLSRSLFKWPGNNTPRILVRAMWRCGTRSAFGVGNQPHPKRMTLLDVSTIRGGNGIRVRACGRLADDVRCWRSVSDRPR